MEYIYENENGVQFDRYFEYLESIQDQLPSHVYVFASNFEHYSLSDHSSLHDAWLDYLNIVEPAEGGRQQLRSIEIEARFLGPFHDKRIYLNYETVVGFELVTPEYFERPSNVNTGHGDLLIHEVRIEDNLVLVHELEFSRGSTFIIKCKNIKHREESYSYT